jgi:hypothetical protein
MLSFALKILNRFFTKCSLMSISHGFFIIFTYYYCCLCCDYYYYRFHHHHHILLLYFQNVAVFIECKYQYLIFYYILHFSKYFFRIVQPNFRPHVFGVTLYIPPLALQPTYGPWPTSMKLSVSLQFTRSWTFGRTPWTGDQLVARPLFVHKHRKTHIHKH